MNNSELSKKIEGYLKSAAAKAKKFEDLVAVTISLISENNEDLYVEVKDGKITVAPYHYDDFGCAIQGAPENIDRVFSGAVSFDKALSDGLVNVVAGDEAKFKALEVLVPSKKAPAKTAAKAPAKKACASKSCAAKPAKAAPAAKAAEAAAKPAEKPAAPVKAASAPAKTATAAAAPKPAAADTAKKAPAKKK